jgi:ATP-binding cassette subfamily B protein
MDCGPASLKCLLEGFGVPVSYGRLREACQTDVDGTSIDTMEEVAAQLGLDAEQVMLPEDHLFLDEADALPAIVVTRQPNGLTHFIVAWRRHGSFVQVMDPGTGRRWPTCAELKSDLYIHTASVPADRWRTWAGSEAFLGPFRALLGKLGISGEAITRLIDRALMDVGWRSMATLEAATRMIDSIVRAHGLRPGDEALRALTMLIERAQADPANEMLVIPANYWSARLAPAGPDGEVTLFVRGAVLVQARGRRPKDESGAADGQPGSATRPLSPELVAALEEKPSRPGRDLLQMLSQDGFLAPAVLIAALALAAGGVMIEGLLFQGLIDLSRKLGPTEQRLGAMAALLVFSVALLCLEWPLAASVLRIGRRLEARLRLAFLEKIPRLGDRYFQSRLISDMAERSHSVQMLRRLPELGGRLLRSIFELTLTTVGLLWLDPGGALVVVMAAVIALVMPIVTQSRLTERDLRIRNHNGALGRFYLDAMLGLVAIRAHVAETAVRREHESLLVEWLRSSWGLLRAAVTVEAVQSLAGFGLAAWLLLDHLSRGGEAVGVLLLVYWVLNLPVLGQEIAHIAQQYPAARNVTLRLHEPLGAPEETELETDDQAEVVVLPSEAIALNPTRAIRHEDTAGDDTIGLSGVAIAFESVSVRAGGYQILNGVDLKIDAGSHLAIVGPSGAGKSSFVGLLLGWHRPASGRVLVDGEVLNGLTLASLRKATAWVDPAIQLWNRTFMENLRYGAPDESALPISPVIETADLRTVLEKLPDGLQTTLGEGGALLSGGEGQRIRLGRAMLRPDVRLVILDEPFRGLARSQRRELLRRARSLWRDATLLCITHDVSETVDFDRVLVVEGGRIVEDGGAAQLAAQSESRYRQLLNAEESVRGGLWASNQWRRMCVDDGNLIEESVPTTVATGSLRGRQNTCAI